MNNDFGLLVNEARFRTLDAQLGRWWQIDPEVEQFEAWSPYNSNLDNPILKTDPQGNTPCCGHNPLDVELPIDIPETGFGGGGSFGGSASFGDAHLGFGEILGDLFAIEAIETESVEIISTVSEMLSGTEKVNKVQAYEVGTFNDLKNRSVSGDDLDIHHVMQGNPAKQTVAGYEYKKAPAIALPRNEHTSIPTQKGSAKLSSRDQLAKDIKDLRTYTNVPTVRLQELIKLNKQMYGSSLSKQQYMDLTHPKILD